MPRGTRQQEAAAKVRHLAKKPHARGHCELCLNPPAKPTFPTDQPDIAVTAAQ